MDAEIGLRSVLKHAFDQGSASRRRRGGKLSTVEQFVLDVRRLGIDLVADPGEDILKPLAAAESNLFSHAEPAARATRIEFRREQMSKLAGQLVAAAFDTNGQFTTRGSVPFKFLHVLADPFQCSEFVQVCCEALVLSENAEQVAVTVRGCPASQ